MRNKNSSTLAPFHAMRFFIRTCFPALLLLLNSCTEPATGSAPVQAGSTGKTPAPPAGKTDSLSYMQKNRLIIPGTGIGETRVGENSDSVIARLGKPDRSDAAMGKAWLIWTSGHENRAAHQTAIFTARNMGVGKEESRVQEIMITSAFFHTADSLQIGMSLRQIKQHMPGLVKLATAGDSTSAAKNLYDDMLHGISFVINASGTCVAIIVHEKNKPVQLYVPLQV